MAYWWRPGAGSCPEQLSAAGLLPRFEDQERAEEWLSLFFGELQDHGVGEVALFEEDRLVYGPMSLDA